MSHQEPSGPERLYVITGGRAGQTAHPGLGLVTLIVSRSQPQPGMAPEQVGILQMCQYPLSVAEISAYLRLPLSAVQVLLAGGGIGVVAVGLGGPAHETEATVAVEIDLGARITRVSQPVRDLLCRAVECVLVGDVRLDTQG